MLTASQRTQLHKDILEYLAKNNFNATAQQFSMEIQLSLADIDPEGNKLEVKWKSILALQKKINNLEELVKSLQDALKASSKNGGTDVKAEDRFLPATPCRFELKGHQGPITSLAFHPLFSSLATSSEDGKVMIWEFQTGKLEKTLRGHTNPVNSVSYDQQGRYLVSCSSDLSIRLWDCNNDYQCFKTLNGHNHNVSFATFNPEGDMVFSCSRDETIRLWDVKTGYCKKTFKGHEKWVRTLSISKDGQTFISASDDQSVIVWNVNKETPVLRFFAHENVIETVLLVEGETSSCLVGSEFLKHKFTQEFRIKAAKQLSEKGSNGMPTYSQSFIFTASRDKLIKIFLTQTGEHLHTFFGHDNWVRSLVIHSNNKYLYSASDDKTVRIWDLFYGRMVRQIDAHTHFIADVKFNQKYGVIATGGNDMGVKIWALS